MDMSYKELKNVWFLLKCPLQRGLYINHTFLLFRLKTTPSQKNALFQQVPLKHPYSSNPSEDQKD